MDGLTNNDDEDDDTYHTQDDHHLLGSERSLEMIFKELMHTPRWC